MMPSKKCVELFKARYEALAGCVYQVPTEAEVAPIIVGILNQIEGIKRVALGSIALQSILKMLYDTQHVELICAPFVNSTLPHLIDTAQVGITHATCAVAEAGALVEVATNDEVRLVSTLPHTHICLLHAQDILMTLEEVAPRLERVFEANTSGCTITFVSGPSRTADIEMKLILGVHGPKASHVIIIDR